MAYIIGPDISFYQDDPETPQGVNFTKMREVPELPMERGIWRYPF